MKYYSEKTQKLYDSEDACVQAETKLQKQQDAAKAEQAKKDAARKEAAAKVEAARQAMVEAQKNYRKELDEFCKQYKTYHYSIKSDDELPHFWDWFLNL